MRTLKYLCAAVAIGSLIALPQSASASPLTAGLGSTTALPELTEGLVQKVHGWHCGKRKGWYHGHRKWHRHYRACRKRYYDDDYYDDDYSYYPYAYSYPYYTAPFLSFSFSPRRHHRHHHHHHGGWDD